jgi:hypothetical protein
MADRFRGVVRGGLGGEEPAERTHVSAGGIFQQTSHSRAEVLRRCLVGARLKSTVDAQALTEVARVHADLNRIGGLLKLAIREGLSDRSSHNRLDLELLDSIIQVRRAVERLAGRR